MPKDEIKTKYYLRLEVADKTGTLAKVAKIFGDNDISIENMITKSKKKMKKKSFTNNSYLYRKGYFKSYWEVKNTLK